MAVSVKPGPRGHDKPLLAINVFNGIQGESYDGYLDQEQAGELAAILKRFAETGDDNVHATVVHGFTALYPKVA